MKLDQQRPWVTGGSFLDRMGARVQAYDDVLLHVDATCVSEGTASPETIPSGSVGTVIFVTEDEPVLLQLECNVLGGFAFADNYPASSVTLYRTAQEKYSNAPD